MQKLGIYLMLFGIGSIILNSFGLEFKIFMWLGEGYTSRIIIAAVGLLLVIIGNSNNKNSEES
jgi:hypothetical protein